MTNVSCFENFEASEKEEDKKRNKNLAQLAKRAKYNHTLRRRKRSNCKR